MILGPAWPGKVGPSGPPAWAESSQALAELAGVRHALEVASGGQPGWPARLSRPAAQEASKWKKIKISTEKNQISTKKK